jgi:hypothetical protein
MEKKKRKKNLPYNREIIKLFIPATCLQLLRRYGPLGKLTPAFVTRTPERTIGSES